jgi:hypothetical protein
MKYRIIEITNGDKAHYEVQKLKMWVFWITETYFDCCIDGLMAGNYPIKFNSIKDAKLFIEKQNIKKEKICLINTNLLINVSSI